jgi:DNA-binding transcriptional LysR family regulator
MLSDFMQLHPRVELHLEATNRRVDVVGEGIDIALRVRPPPLEDSDLVLRVLADRGQCLIGSPGLLERHATPRSPADLAGLPSLALGAPRGEHSWHLFGPDGAQVSIHHQPRLVTGSMTALRAAALAGVGIVQLPRMLVRAALARGELVAVLPQWAPRREIIHAVFASRRGLLPAVRALVDFLAERFALLDED